MATINKAIIPAAGLGKRMHPLSTYMPKPMLPLGKKPVLHHIVEEIRSAGISDILVVVRSEHTTIKKYFRSDAHISFQIDDSAGGPGEAVLAGEEFIAGDPFLVVFSDAPLAGQNIERAITEMQEVFHRYAADSVMSIYNIPKEEAGSRGIVRIAEELSGRLFRINAIVEKPGSINSTEPKASSCRYLFTPDLFDALRKAERDEDGELQLTAGVNELLAGDRDVFGTYLPDEIVRHDTGNFEGYFKALSAFTEMEE